MWDDDDDLAFALALQDEINNGGELKQKSPAKNGKPESIVDPVWEYIDPVPDIFAMFIEFNHAYFDGKLEGVEVKWSTRMTLCAGVCSYERGGGLCSVRLSQPLLKFRPRKDLVETLLHEMIHAYLFVTHNNRDHDDHGPEFHKHMYRINQRSGTKITVYHSFHDEVNNYRQHWWKCNGPCQHRKPFYGLVKRAANRAPGPYDRWWSEHQSTCGGTYVKIKEPENYKSKKRKTENADGSISEVPDAKKPHQQSTVPFTGRGHVLGNATNIGNANSNSSGGSGTAPKRPALGNHQLQVSGSNIMTFGILQGNGATPPSSKRPGGNSSSNAAKKKPAGRGGKPGGQLTMTRFVSNSSSTITLPAPKTKPAAKASQTDTTKTKPATTATTTTTSASSPRVVTITDLFRRASDTSLQHVHPPINSTAAQGSSGGLVLGGGSRPAASAIRVPLPPPPRSPDHSGTVVIESTPPPSRAIVIEDTPPPAGAAGETCDCPVCHARVPSADLNDHLDLCLFYHADDSDIMEVL